MKIYTVGAKWEGVEEDEFVVIQQGMSSKVDACRMAGKLYKITDECWRPYVLEIDGKSQKHINF